MLSACIRSISLINLVCAILVSYGSQINAPRVVTFMVDYA